MSKARTMSNLLTSSGDVITTALDNVGAAGALMDSELANIAAVKATTGTFLTADQTKLDTIETSADVTDAANVTSSGALMLTGGTVSGTLTTTAEIVANGGIALGDNDKATFGASDDLQIYHDGSNSWFKGNNAGNNTVVVAPGGTGSVLITNSSGDNIITQQGDVAMLHHNGSTKLATTSTGATVTGTLNATTVDLGNWTVTESSGVLFFATGGTNKMKLDASGNMTCVGNVTAYGSV